MRRGLLALAVLLGLFFSVESPERTIDGPRTERVVLVDYGFHTGIALERKWFTQKGLFLDLPPGAWIEVGWGDEIFFRETTSLSEFKFRNAWRAVAGLGETAVHAVVLPTSPEGVFNPDWLTIIDLDEEGVRRIAAEIDRTLSRPVERLSEGHFREISGFYRSGVSYGPTRLCNHWVSDALNKAGLPSSSFWATFPDSLRWELQLRD